MDAGFYKLASLGDYVWADNNADGQQNDGAANGINGVKVDLYTGAGVFVASQMTANDGMGNPGYYLFGNLVPGDYKVVFNKPAGYNFTTQDAGGDGSDSDANPANGMTIVTTLVSGENDLSWDAGLVKLASIGDRVWEDSNGNGVQDGTESGIAGASVELYTCVGGVQGVFVAGTTTDGMGNYSFANLTPGEYLVKFLTPAGGYTETTANVGADGADSDAVGGLSGCYTLAAGENNTTVDAGFYKLASLGDRVWVDTNANGIQDVGESGKAGVKVELYTCVNNAPGVLVGTQTTDGTGNYNFTGLKPGNYIVKFIANDGSVLSQSDQTVDDTKDSDAGANGLTGCYTLVSGQNNTTVDAGFYEKASIGDRVWVDIDQDGVQDTGEPGVAGVKVYLLDGAGVQVGGPVTTNANGDYLFSNLTPGTYSVQFDLASLPAGYMATVRDAAAATDATDSDADPTTGRTINTVLDSGENDLSWDFGIKGNVGIDIEKLVHGEYLEQGSTGGEGLTPGFWKNHSAYGPAPLSGWPETGLSPDASYETIFGVNVSGISHAVGSFRHRRRWRQRTDAPFLGGPTQCGQPQCGLLLYDGANHCDDPGSDQWRERRNDRINQEPVCLAERTRSRSQHTGWQRHNFGHHARRRRRHRRQRPGDSGRRPGSVHLHREEHGQRRAEQRDGGRRPYRDIDLRGWRHRQRRSARCQRDVDIHGNRKRVVCYELRQYWYRNRPRRSVRRDSDGQRRCALQHAYPGPDPGRPGLARHQRQRHSGCWRIGHFRCHRAIEVHWWCATADDNNRCQRHLSR